MSNQLWLILFHSDYTKHQWIPISPERFNLNRLHFFPGHSGEMLKIWNPPDCILSQQTSDYYIMKQKSGKNQCYDKLTQCTKFVHSLDAATSSILPYEPISIHWGHHHNTDNMPTRPWQTQSIGQHACTVRTEVESNVVRWQQETDKSYLDTHHVCDLLILVLSVWKWSCDEAYFLSL